LEIKLDAREYFYPYLLVDPVYTYDYAHFEEYGMSKEDYEKQKKINKMLQDKKYEDLFKKKLIENLEDFLRKLEYEVRIHYEDGKSLEQKVSDSEDIIFQLIEKKGPNAFRHAAVLNKIKHWYNAKDSPNIENLSKALVKSGKINERYYVFYYAPAAKKTRQRQNLPRFLSASRIILLKSCSKIEPTPIQPMTLFLTDRN